MLNPPSSCRVDIVVTALDAGPLPPWADLPAETHVLGELLEAERVGEGVLKGAGNDEEATAENIGLQRDVGASRGGRAWRGREIRVEQDDGDKVPPSTGHKRADGHEIDDGRVGRVNVRKMETQPTER